MNPVETSGLSATYASGTALQNVTWTVKAGDFWAVVGPNGSGKTTLLKAVLGLLPSGVSGRAALFGDPPTACRQWSRIGYLPQIGAPAFAGFPATVREVVSLGRLSLKRFPRWSGRADEEAVQTVLERLGIAGLAARRIGELSGGQRQRALLARALVNRPALLLLDEPVVALDPESREQFYGLLRDLHRNEGTAVVLITHDSGTAGRFADHLLYLDRQVVFAGSFQDFCRSPAMGQHFGALAQHAICHQHEGEGPPWET